MILKKQYSQLIYTPVCNRNFGVFGNTVDDPIEDFEFPVDQTPIVVVDQDCQFVINLVKTQDDSILSTKDKVTKQKLYIHLKEIGWRRNRILNSFQKIREEVL